MGGRADRFHAPALDVDFMCIATFGRTRDDLQTGDRADGRQRLTAKAQCGDAHQVIIAQFGRGMALDGKLKFFSRHAETIVGDTDQTAATGDNSHINGAGAGIYGVFHQLLDDACRAFNDLTGGNTVDRAFR